MKKSTKFAMRAVPLVITLAIAGQAYAQEKLDEVVVSAQKRTQRIQDVPMSISAISGQTLEDRKIEGAADLQGSVPNLSVVAAPVSSLIGVTSIRGLGTGQPAIWMDPAVGMYVDGVFVGKNQGALFDMLDLERVEVLRGPQGTLFGRNTLGGAVNFVTRKPSGQFSGNVGLELGNYGRSVQKISVDTPKTQEGLSLTIAGRKEKQDGWLANAAAADKWGNRDREAIKLNATFDVSKDTQLFYKYDNSTIHETATPISVINDRGYYSYIGYGAPLAAVFGPRVQVGVPTSTTSSFAPQQDLKVKGHAWGFETVLDANNKFKYTGSRRQMAYHDTGELDATPLPYYGSQSTTDYSADTHEFQITGAAKDINYVAGIYLFKDSGTSINDQFGYLVKDTPTSPPGSNQQNFGLGSDAKAVYGQVDYALSKETTLTGGLRYTSEKKTGSVWRTATSPGVFAPLSTLTWRNGMAPGNNHSEATFSSLTPSLSLSQKLNANQMVFGRLAKGFKSGGFPLQAAETYAQAFKPENSTSYEAGFKGAEGAASYSATVFLTKLKDQQISYLPPGSGSPTTANAGASTYKGIELEGAIKLSKDTKLQAGYGYLDAKFDKYPIKTISGANIDGASNLVVGYAPKHTFNMALDSNLGNTSLGRLKGLVEYRFVGSYYNYTANKSMTPTVAVMGNYAPDSKMAALGTINTRLTLDQIQVGGPGQMDVSLWVKNLNNKQVMQNMIDFAVFQVGYWSNPRTVGLTANYKW